MFRGLILTLNTSLFKFQLNSDHFPSDFQDFCGLGLGFRIWVKISSWAFSQLNQSKSFRFGLMRAELIYFPLLSTQLSRVKKFQSLRGISRWNFSKYFDKRTGLLRCEGVLSMHATCKPLAQILVYFRFSQQVQIQLKHPSLAKHVLHIHK